ncbi:MAG: hypothetical protein KAU90_04150 [Sulfurovaceae bacterium]|nr:hypothetical protein [Sulfurovaceae bacterium]
MKKIMFKTLLTTVVASSMALADNPLYEKAGTINIIDHKAMVAGSKAPGKDKFAITLEDTGIITGHICGCTTAAFLVTKDALKKLYPDTMPLRRGVNVEMSAYNMDIVDAVTYLTGTRFNRAETNYDFIINPDLQGKKGTITIKFTRKDNKKSITAVIDRMKILTKDEAKIVKTIKPKVKAKTASKEEIMKLAKTQQVVVKKLITDLPKDAITYSSK